MIEHHYHCPQCAGILGNEPAVESRVYDYATVLGICLDCGILVTKPDFRQYEWVKFTDLAEIEGYGVRFVRKVDGTPQPSAAPALSWVQGNTWSPPSRELSGFSLRAGGIRHAKR